MSGGQYRRGVNIAGAAFGSSSLPGVLGRDYTFESEATYQYFGTKGLGLIRFALQWERLQPIPSGPLDPTYLANLKQVINWATAHDCSVILNLHNYGRYSFVTELGLTPCIIDNPEGDLRITRYDLADLWRRLSSEFKFEPAVCAYGLMNEPHDMTGGDWKTISQASVDAIRANQDGKLILVPGDSWSTANRWAQVNGPVSWISDPADNFAYEAHVYFDTDEGGTYAKSYDEELSINPDLAEVGRTRVSRFISWCQSNNVQGMVGEYGIPGDEPRRISVLDNFLSALDLAQMDGTYWAAGEWWGDYRLSVQPTANFTMDRPQMPTLLSHVTFEHFFLIE